MRIGITMDDALSPDGGGCSVYVRQLIPHLAEVASDCELVLIHARHPAYSRSSVPDAPNVRWVEVPIARKLLHRGLWPLLGRPHVERFAGPLDVFHNTLTTTSVPARAPTVLTIHDLFPERFPSHFKPTGRIYRKALLRQARKGACAIIAISEATKRDVVELLGIPGTRVTVIHHGVPLREGIPAEEEPEAFRAYGLDRPYFLFIGRIDPRKNIERLLSAFHRASRSFKTPMTLALAGGRGWRAGRIDDLVTRLRLSESVRMLGFVPDAHVPMLMRRALALVYPSRYEGFGFPLLEAMVSSTPIAASNTSSIPEVAGSAAVYFDPLDESDMAAALEALAADDGLRTRLVEAGTKRLSEFSWRKTAEETLAVYRAVAGAGPG